MEAISKQDKILDALQELLENSDIQKISVSDIAEKAGIGKGSIYYYFSSKNAIFSALIERNYQIALDTAKTLATQTDVPPFTRMAMISQACNDAAVRLSAYSESSTLESIQEKAYVHQKYVGHIISELKPVLAEIIKQAISIGEISFNYPKQLAEIVLIILSVKNSNQIIPSTNEEIMETFKALVSLLEKGCSVSEGMLDYLIEADPKL